MTKENKTMKKLKKIKLRLILPGLAATLFLISLGLNKIEFMYSCSEIKAICAGPSTVLIFLLTTPGVILYSFVVGNGPFSADENFIIIILSLFFYFFLGYLIEKLITIFKSKKAN